MAGDRAAGANGDHVSREETNRVDAILCLRAQAGDEVAREELVRRIRHIARACAQKRHFACGDRDDVMGESLYGLVKGIRDWRPGHGVSVRAFCSITCARQLKTALTQAKYRLRYSLLDDVPHQNKDGSSREREEASLGPTPEQALVWRQECDDARTLLRSAGLTPLQAVSYIGVETGCSYAEIAKRLGKDLKSVDNARVKAKRKLARAREAMAS